MEKEETKNKTGLELFYLAGCRTSSCSLVVGRSQTPATPHTLYYPYGKDSSSKILQNVYGGAPPARLAALDRIIRKVNTAEDSFTPHTFSP